MCKCSIIIPIYNTEKYLQYCLDSVLRQTEKDIEIICVNDGSTDNSLNILTTYSKKDTRIIVINQKNTGVSSARNNGLQKAKGIFIAFLDADDIWQPQTLELLSEALQKNVEAVLVWGKYKRFESATGKYIPQPSTPLQQPNILWYSMLIDSMLPIGTFLVRSEAAKQYFFNPNLRIGEDRDWLLHLVRGKKTVFLAHTFLYYRQHSGSAVRDYEQFLRDEATMLAHHLADKTIPHKIIRMAQSSHDFHSAVLLAKMPGKKGKAFRYYLQAILKTPWYLELYLRPLRKLWQKILPKKTLPEVKLYLYP